MSAGHGPLIALIEIALNRALALDPELPARLAPLQGRVVAVHLSGTPSAVGLAPHGGGIALVPGSVADAQLHGSAAAVLRYLLHADTPHVRIEGDGTLAAALAAALRAGRPDLEDALARAVGDIPARRTAQAARALREQMGGIGDGLVQSVTEFLQHERPALPSAQEYAAFGADLENLCARLDALAARVDALAPAHA